MPRFHETGYGQKFLNRQLPNLIKSLNEIGKELKRQNDLKEEENKDRIKDAW